MATIIPTFLRPLFTRSNSGDTFYDITNSKNWAQTQENLYWAQNHPILTPAMLFVSKLFSQAEFYWYDKETKKKTYTGGVLDLINKPNYYQTKNDFLEQVMFMMIAQGQSIVWARKGFGNIDPSVLYILDKSKIQYPEEMNKRGLPIRNEDNPIQNQYIIYDQEGLNERIQIKDLMFFNDMPNCVTTTNLFETGSRLDGLEQTIKNTVDSLKAKNIILKSNGKEMIKGKGAGLQMSSEEQKEAKRLMNGSYGLGVGRSRSFITKADVTWESMHIALRDLGLDESVKVDGNLIYTALHIPKDILSLEAKKTTYNNFKESMVSYVQNEMQSFVDGFCEVINKTYSDGQIVLKGDYEDLPIMQFILLERYKGVLTRAQALKALRDAGLPDEEALEMLGMDTKIKLNEIQQPTQQESQGSNEGANGENNS